MEIIGRKFSETFSKDNIDWLFVEPFFLIYIPIYFLGYAFQYFYEFTITFEFSDLLMSSIQVVITYMWILFINQKQ